jgi:hypothetical protein
MAHHTAITKARLNRGRHELEDHLEIRDPKARRIIKQGNADILAGRTKPGDELLEPAKRRLIVYLKSGQ